MSESSSADVEALKKSLNVCKNYISRPFLCLYSKERSHPCCCAVFMNLHMEVGKTIGKSVINRVLA